MFEEENGVVVAVGGEVNGYYYPQAKVPLVLPSISNGLMMNQVTVFLMTAARAVCKGRWQEKRLNHPRNLAWVRTKTGLKQRRWLRDLRKRVM